MANETINLDFSTARVLQALQPVTNGEDFSVTLNLFQGGVPADLDGKGLAISVSHAGGMEAFALAGVLSDDDDGVTSVVTFTARAATMATLPPGSYTIAARLTDGTETRQVLLARLPVRAGGFG
ncbi:MAG: hypothetical protein KIT43_10175 [Bauldia sp.]|nr:hypothetical protein [Bauldia sp.]